MSSLSIADPFKILIRLKISILGKCFNVRVTPGSCAVTSPKPITS